SVRLGASGEPTTTRFTVGAKDLSPRSRARIVLETSDGTVLSTLSNPSVPSNGRLASTSRIPRDLAPGRYVIRLIATDITVESPFNDPSAILGQTYNYRITPFNGSTPGEPTVIENVRIPADPRLEANVTFDGKRQPTTVNFAWTGRDLRPGSTAVVRLESIDGTIVVELGRVTVGPDGTLDAHATIPRDLAPGSYRLIIEAIDVYGTEIDSRFDFEITSTWSPSDAADFDGSGGETNTDDSSADDKGVSGVLRGILYAAMALMVVGLIAMAGWWFIVARRRDEEEEEIEDNEIESDIRP
ncbi:MAG: hypothetical protein EBZ93_05840, partial [Actinobacteria bacterium]|nr:hypothetical protein [Actinomycetota bacterium]